MGCGVGDPPNANKLKKKKKISVLSETEAKWSLFRFLFEYSLENKIHYFDIFGLFRIIFFASISPQVLLFNHAVVWSHKSRSVALFVKSLHASLTMGESTHPRIRSGIFFTREINSQEVLSPRSEQRDKNLALSRTFYS